MDITDRFCETTNGTRPAAAELTIQKEQGDDSITVDALSGWTTTTPTHFVIYRLNSDGTKEEGSQSDWKGFVSGSTITDMQLKAGTDSIYPVGSVVIASPTAAWADDVVEGIVQEHHQDGSHANVTADSLSVAENATFSGNVTFGAATLDTIRGELFGNCIVSGGVWSQVSGLNGEMTTAVVYINGKRLTIGAVTSGSPKTFAASSDTFVIFKNDGSIDYLPVGNNAAEPVIPAGAFVSDIVVTNETAVVRVLRYGNEATGAPHHIWRHYNSVNGVILAGDTANNIAGQVTRSNKGVLLRSGTGITTGAVIARSGWYAGWMQLYCKDAAASYRPYFNCTQPPDSSLVFQLAEIPGHLVAEGQAIHVSFSTYLPSRTVLIPYAMVSAQTRIGSLTNTQVQYGSHWTITEQR